MSRAAKLHGMASMSRCQQLGFEQHESLPDMMPKTKEVNKRLSLCRSLSQPCRVLAGVSGSTGSGSYTLVVTKLVVLYSAPEHAPVSASYIGMGYPLLLHDGKGKAQYPSHDYAYYILYSIRAL